MLSVNGNSTGTTTAVVLNNIAKEDVSFIGKDILYIKTSLNNFSTSKVLFYCSNLFWSLLLIPLSLVLIVFVLILLTRNSIIDIRQLQRGSASKQAIKYLHKSKTDLHTSIENSLQLFMFEKWNLERSKFNKQDILDVLNDKGVDESLINEFNQIIEACEMARFTSVQSVVNELELKTLTVSLIEKLENY